MRSKMQVVANELVVNNTTLHSENADVTNYRSVSFGVLAAGAGFNLVATVQKSNDGTNWDDTTVTETLTAAGYKVIEVPEAVAGIYRVKLVESGSANATVSIKAIMKEH